MSIREATACHGSYTVASPGSGTDDRRLDCGEFLKGDPRRNAEDQARQKGGVLKRLRQPRIEKHPARQAERAF